MKKQWRKGLLAAGVLAAVFVFSYCSKKTDDVQPAPANSVKHGGSSSMSSIMQAALDAADIHNAGLDFVLDYPGYDDLNLTQRVDISRSYFKINGIQTNMDFDADDIKGFFDNYDYENPAHMIEQMQDNGVIDATEKEYLDQAVAVVNSEGDFDTRIGTLEVLLNDIDDNADLAEDSKTRMLYAVAIFKGSVTHWNNKMLGKASNSCNDCLADNLWKIGLLDGVGTIVGLFGGPGISVATALAVSITSSCALCNMCSGCGGGWQTNNPPCGACPYPSLYDGANCYYGRPTSGGVFIMNGNLYWDDPTHNCQLPTFNGQFTQGTWDGAHCFYPIPSGASAFEYENGLYIDCD